MQLQKSLITLAFSVLLTSGVAVASATGFDMGLRAFAAGDFKAALAQWIPLAEQGHVIAQNNVGVMYAKGNGVIENDNTAVVWLTLAAEQGFAEAQYELGGMYARGEGVSSDTKTALKLLTLAAEQGFAEAQASVGLMYYSGTGVLSDNIRAYTWFDLAAHNGDEIAQGLKKNIIKEMSAGDISKAQDMSSRCLKSGYTQCF